MHPENCLDNVPVRLFDDLAILGHLTIKIMRREIRIVWSTVAFRALEGK